MRNVYRKVIELAVHNPVSVLIAVYLSIILLGFLILCLPFLQRKPIGIIDHLFIASSAVSTTGLTSVSVADSYNFFGQLIILLLIQIGGIHYMSFGSLILLAGRKKMNKFHEKLIKDDFGLPDDFNAAQFVKSVVIFSFGVELIGAVFLYFIFLGKGVEQPLWNAVFHSISAFCTAGFSLFNTSLESFAGDPLLNIVIIILSCMGAMGFIVVVDYWQKFRGKRKDVTLTTKIIVWFTFLVIGLGTLLLLITNAFGSKASFAEQSWMALFQSMTALTTVGFDTFPIGQMSHSALFLILLFMIMGSSPAGTGGGIKSTTVVAVMAQTFHSLRGKANVTFLGYQIPDYRLRIASASFTFYILVLATGTYFLNLAEQHSVFEVIFEAASALGTVGLSMGITGALSSWGKMIIICLMIVGRLGPLTIGLALFSKKKEPDNIGWHEDVVVG